MKNFTNVLLTIASGIALFTAQTSVGSTHMIEVYNKENTSIQLDITEMGTGGRKNFPTVYVAANQQWRSGDRNVDMNAELEFTISDKGKMIGRYQVNAPGKTKYLSWDRAKNPSLYPQTGPLLGLLGQTKSGYGLENNVRASQISKK